MTLLANTVDIQYTFANFSTVDRMNSADNYTYFVLQYCKHGRAICHSPNWELNPITKEPQYFTTERFVGYCKYRAQHIILKPNIIFCRFVLRLQVIHNMIRKYEMLLLVKTHILTNLCPNIIVTSLFLTCCIGSSGSTHYLVI